MDLILRVEGPSGQPIALASVLEALGLPRAPPADVSEGARGVEVGRAATGATLVLEPGPTAAPAGCDPFLPLEQLRAPLLRAPSFAEDALVPVLEALAGLAALLRPIDRTGTLGDPLDVDEALVLWTRERARAARELVALCRDTGAPPPPHLPGSDLRALHAWLVAASHADDDGGPPVARPIVCLDEREGLPVRCAVALPARGRVRVPPGLDWLVSDDDETRLVTAEALAAFLDADERDDRGFRVVDLDGQVGRALAGAAGLSLARFRTVTPVEVLDDETLFADE